MVLTSRLITTSYCLHTHESDSEYVRFLRVFGCCFDEEDELPPSSLWRYRLLPEAHERKAWGVFVSDASPPLLQEQGQEQRWDLLCQ